MPWSAGNYTKGNAGSGGWTGDASLGIGIEAGRHDTQDNDFATGIDACINKDGSNAFSGNVNFGNNRPVNINLGDAATPGICLGGDANTGIFGPAADTWAVATNGVEKLRVTSTGEVGINHTAPTSTLDIRDTDTKITATNFAASASGAFIELQKSRSATVGTNTIVNNGDVLGQINFQGANGTTFTPGAAIQASVDGDPGATNDMPGRLIFFTTPNASGTLTERMRITQDGKIGFGTGNPNQKFTFDGADDNVVQLNAPARPRIMWSASGATKAQTGYDTTTSFAGVANILFVQNNTAGVYLGLNATSWTAVSDERLKKNIQSLNYGLSEILGLRPVRYDMLSDATDESSRLGFIAQETKLHIPEAVLGDEDHYFGLTVTDLIPVAVKAIQELNAKVEALEARVAELEA
jgi:hypothetical protein